MKSKIRNEIVSGASRVVIKLGTRLLTDTSLISHLMKDIAELRMRGIQVILVSSGAVGLGIKTMNLKKRPGKLSEIQAMASVGQSKLMALYEKEAEKLGFHTGQLLLTAADLQSRERYLNVMNCLEGLLSDNILPLVNENDAVSVDELKFGDNDILAALLATMTRSDLTVLMTTVDGLFSVRKGCLDERLTIVDSINDDIKKIAGKSDGNRFSIGGMKSKINAGEIVLAAGEPLWIINGTKKQILLDVFDGKDVGTLFIPANNKKQMQGRKRWIGFFSSIKGKLFVDNGACKALRKKGRSLLPSGIKLAEGNFQRGDSVDICNEKGKVFARGLVNYSIDEVNNIKGLQSSQISKKLFCDASDDVIIHRNNLTILSN